MERNVLPWDAQLIERQSPAGLVAIAREGRLVREDGKGPARVDLAWVDEAALALIDLAVGRGRNLSLVYPAPAGELSVLLAAQLLLHRFINDRSLAVGIVTADTTLAARTWEELRIATLGDRAPVSTVFPCWRAGPNGESPLGRRAFRGLIVGERCRDWPVDVLIEDHLAGPVVGDPRLPTVALFGDPLDRELARRADGDELVWGWSEDDLALWNEALEKGTEHRMPFSVSHKRLATIARGIAIKIEIAHHPGAELSAKRAREDLRLLREMAGSNASRVVTKGMAVAWHHLQTLASLPCSPSRFDRFAGMPPWAPRPTATFEPEMTAWAKTLQPDLAEVAGILASDLGDLRASLEEGNPFQVALEQVASGSCETLLITRTRAASRALIDALGQDPDVPKVGSLVLLPPGGLNRQGSWPQAIAVGAWSRLDWHRLDSGIAEGLRVLVLGNEAATESQVVLRALKHARRRWGSLEVRERTWRALVGGQPPSAPPTPPISEPVVEIIAGPDFVPQQDHPFDQLASLLEYEPLRIGPEGLEERLARETEDGEWAAKVPAVEVATDRGRIKLEVGRAIEVRIGPRIVDKTPDELQPGDYLLIGRQRGRLGLLEALEERLRHRRPDLLAGRLLIESYHQRVRSCFAESRLTIAELQRRLAAVGCEKTVFAVKSWVTVDGTIAPRDEEDLFRLNDVLELDLGTRRLAELFAAVQRWRGFRRAAGRVLAEAARSSTSLMDSSRIDPDTGLSVADLREAVIEACVISVDNRPAEVPLAELGRLMGA